MTETELRLILRGSTKEELENKLVDLFGVIEDRVQQIEQMKRCGNCKHLDEHNEAFICNYFGRYINNLNVVNSVSACGRWELPPATSKPCPACKWHDLDMKGCANIVCYEHSEFEEEK